MTSEMNKTETRGVKKTFYNEFEKKLDPNKKRSDEVMKHVFMETANYLKELLRCETNILPLELPQEVIANFDDEGHLAESMFTENFIRIIFHGIKARKVEIEQNVGEFDFEVTEDQLDLSAAGEEDEDVEPYENI